MRVAVILGLSLLLAACSPPDWLTPYRVEIHQGNYVSQDMVAKLRPGMSRSQVRFALGTPLLADPFHKDRWDYIYVFEKDEKIVQRRVITVIFAEDKLVRVEGDVVAAAAPAGDAGVPPARAPVKESAPVTEGPKQEKGFFGSIWEKVGF